MVYTACVVCPSFSVMATPAFSMVGAYMVGAHMVGAHMVGTYMVGAHMVSAHMVGTYMVGTYMVGAHMVGAATYLSITHALRRHFKPVLLHLLSTLSESSSISDPLHTHTHTHTRAVSSWFG